MIAFITTAVLGTLVCIIGIINMTGNISSLHSYHRHRVSEADRKPFGRLVGLGTLIIGIAMILFGAMFFVYELTGREMYVVIGTTLMLLGIIVGLVISFYAMMKYNKGIF